MILNQNIRDLMAGIEDTMDSIENSLQQHLNLEESKDEIIARQTATIKRLEEQLREITETLG